MKRLVGSGHATAITAALDALPQWLADELRGTHFYCGADPLFTGLHHFEETSDQRSYRNTAHVVYGYHLLGQAASDRHTTVVMPIPETPAVVIHELGHVLHERLGWPRAPAPVTGYASTNELEAFAEAFTAAHVPGYAPREASRARLAAYKQRYPALARYFTPREEVVA